MASPMLPAAHLVRWLVGRVGMVELAVTATALSTLLVTPIAIADSMQAATQQASTTTTTATVATGSTVVKSGASYVVTFVGCGQVSDTLNVDVPDGNYNASAIVASGAVVTGQADALDGEVSLPDSIAGQCLVTLTLTLVPETAVQTPATASATSTATATMRASATTSKAAARQAAAPAQIPTASKATATPSARIPNALPHTGAGWAAQS